MDKEYLMIDETTKLEEALNEAYEKGYEFFRLLHKELYQGKMFYTVLCRRIKS